MIDFRTYIYGFGNFFRTYYFPGGAWQAFWYQNTQLVGWLFTDIFHGIFVEISDGRRREPWRMFP